MDNHTLFIQECIFIEHAYMFHNFFAAYARGAMEMLLDALRGYCAMLEAKIGQTKFALREDGVLFSFSPDFLDIAHKVCKSLPIQWYFGSLEHFRANRHLLDGPINGPVIICNWVLLDFFINSLALLGGGALAKLKAHNHPVIGIGHTMIEAVYYAPFKEREEFLQARILSYFCGFSHYIAISKDAKRAFEATFRACGVEMEIICGGYPRLDKRIMANKLANNELISQFLFIPRLTKPKELLCSIQRLLELGRRVVFRKHGAYANYAKWQGMQDPYALFEPLLGHPLFCFDENKSITFELLAQSIVITDNSSVAYSAPFVSLKPCILFAPPKPEFDLQIKNFGVSFDCPMLHRLALDEEGLIGAALELERDLLSHGREMIQQIEQFRNQNMYHLQKSANFIASELVAMHAKPISH